MKKPVILCVDDERIVLTSLKTELKDVLGDKCLIETAGGGEDALELFRELGEEGYEISLVIADYIMPDIKGDELLKHIHKISPKTLKVLLTGQAGIEGVTNAVNHANLYRYIGKPWENADLILTVTEAVRSYFKDREIEEKNRELERLNKKLAEYNRELEQKVDERTRQLNETLQEMEKARDNLGKCIREFRGRHRGS